MATNFGHILNNSFGGLIGLPKIVSIEAILSHVQSRLPQFASENRNGEIQNENGLTQVLVKLLNNKHSFPFNFEKEDMEDPSKGDSPRSDFAIVSDQNIKFNTQTIADRQRIFTFEAKRLSNLGKPREKEYLVGRYDNAGKFINSGGIERFKNGTHGIGLDHIGILAYVQLHDFSYWEEKLNGIVADLCKKPPTIGDIHNPAGVTWDNDDTLLLQGTTTKDQARYLSKSLRDHERISIHHLWVSLI